MTMSRGSGISSLNKHAHDPQFDFPLGLTVNDGIAPRAEHPQEAIIPAAGECRPR